MSLHKACGWTPVLTVYPKFTFFLGVPYLDVLLSPCLALEDTSLSYLHLSSMMILLFSKVNKTRTSSYKGEGKNAENKKKVRNIDVSKAQVSDLTII